MLAVAKRLQSEGGRTGAVGSGPTVMPKRGLGHNTPFKRRPGLGYKQNQPQGGGGVQCSAGPQHPQRGHNIGRSTAIGCPCLRNPGQSSCMFLRELFCTMWKAGAAAGGGGGGGGVT